MPDISSTVKALDIHIKVNLFKGLSKSRLRKDLRKRKDQEAGEVQAKEREILSNIGAYEEFFEASGFSCPLPEQYRRAREEGIPSIAPLIELLLTAEMTTGVLMGFHDHSAIEGTLLFDAAEQGESFQGVRSEVLCNPGEIIMRDDAGIIGSYFQGPDGRTAISSGSKDVIVFGFGVPGMSEDLVAAAMQKASSYLEPAASEVIYEL